MCGINCVVGPDSAADVSSMNEVLTHRGPDQCGTFHDDDVALSLNRLSILDPSEKGKQPMTAAGTTIAYNGEIYNFRELRSELVDKGYEFSSDTDTEVVLKGYIDQGEAFLERLNGIFAVALYDQAARTLSLFRDRLGIKPLYYAHTDSGFVASSEIKTITEQFGGPRGFRQDGVAIHEYLHTRNVEAESFFDEITRVPPGTLVTYDVDADRCDHTRIIDPYDSIDRETYQRRQQATETELVDELDEALNDAVKRQLVSDVPVATICSGGLDSSLVTAIAQQYKPDINVYHVSVDHPGLDEQQYARQVADYLGLDMVTETLDREQFVETVDDCIYYNDLPLVHPNSVGVSQICERAHEDGIKVLLTGEGADELFGGYTRYKQFYYLSRLNSLNPLPGLWKRLTGNPHSAYVALNDTDELLNQFLVDRTTLSGEDSHVAARRRDRVNRLRGEYDFVSNDTRQTSMAYMASDLSHYLVPLLRRADRMSMQHSIESRVPFLDNEIVEFALNLPHEYKLHRLSTKYLLKKVGERYLPNEIVYRNKQGFPLPAADWLGLDAQQDAAESQVKIELYERWKDRFSPAL